MPAGEIVSSSADMLSGIDFSGTAFDGGSEDSAVTDVGDAESVDEGSADAGTESDGSAIDDVMPEEGEGEDQEAAESENAAEPESEAEATPPAAQAEQLPDGVREVTGANGKKEMRLTPSRYETFHGAHKTLRELEALAGEPITPEAFDVRNRAFIGQERLYGDLLSGEPEAQTKVLGHFIDEAQAALQNGEVGTDPTIGLGQAFYSTLQSKAPDAFAHLRMRAAGDLMNEMYAEAQKTGDKNLAISASHIAKALGLSYKKDAEITQFLAIPPASADPVASLRAENQRLQEQLNGRQTTNAAEQWQTWKGSTTKAVTSGVLSDAVLPSLTAERKAWEKFPTQFESLVVAPLNKAVKQTISQDQNFNTRIQLLERSAQRAPSAQKRAEIAEQIKQAYVNRARLAVDAHKAGILREAAALLKQGSDATHQRRQAAQQQRGPRGPQNPVQQSLVPGRDVVNPGGVFDAKQEASRLARLLA